MTSNEKEALKIIWQNKGESPLSKIANELRLSADYSRLILRSLVRDGILKFSEGQYKITEKGKKKLIGKSQKHKVILKKRKKKDLDKVKTTLAKLLDIPLEIAENLAKKGLRTLEDIAIIGLSRLLELVEGLELKQAADIINKARAILKKRGKEDLWGE